MSNVSDEMMDSTRIIQEFSKSGVFEIEDRQPKDVKKVWRHKRLVSKMSSSSTWIVQEQQQYMDSTRIFQEFSENGYFRN